MTAKNLVVETQVIAIDDDEDASDNLTMKQMQRVAKKKHFVSTWQRKLRPTRIAMTHEESQEQPETDLTPSLPVPPPQSNEPLAETNVAPHPSESLPEEQPAPQAVLQEPMVMEEQPAPQPVLQEQEPAPQGAEPVIQEDEPAEAFNQPAEPGDPVLPQVQSAS